VISFHSLEDRIVKQFIASRSSQPSTSRHMPARATVEPTFERLGAAVSASEAEVEANPRARSAKLRAARRTTAAPRPFDRDEFRLPRLPRPDGTSVR
jgi:16S rRNA (cytosine1402-N4)-methyltransferase